ncbi:RNA-directed DNA polymerase, eukaryota [Tanacetum coccineum]|uniref:RNA-directed DNA polymerase, eukaryota n=1 Tax=Tanacetum coccineum TaxID=301880 RepID=A0ABQ4ZMS4_9ASTR
MNVHAPQSRSQKKLLWNFIHSFMQNNVGEFIIFWDFNVVRHAHERQGTTFCSYIATDFKKFITDSDLFDIPLGGRAFTRMNKNCSQMSKLDRFFVTNGILDLFPNIHRCILPSMWSDHCPILLKNEDFDYGPIPFKLFSSWFLCDGFKEVVRQSWSEMECSNGVSSFISFKNKLKHVKNKIKHWNKHMTQIRNGDRQKLLKNLEDIDKELDNGIDPLHLAPQRMNILNDLFAIDTLKNMNLAQKNRKLWCMHGDENSNFFHSSLKRKWKKLAVSGITANGLWVTKELIKVDVFAFVHEFFNSSHIPRGCNSSFITLIPKKHNPMNVKDYRPISLIGIQYKVLAKILANRLASVIDSVISNEQLAFIKGRQILDGPLMINEIVEWCKRRKKKAMLFKIDFEKAFDMISWDYIFSRLHHLGFGSKWIRWIKACLSSLFALVLINGSPTTEFKIGRGLRQGDPLSPFLFIIRMEGLHVAIQDAIDSNLFTGLYVGNNNCFGIANKHSKIKLIWDWDSSRRAHKNANWSPIIGKAGKRLSTWKANLLSIGGRLTLIKSGGNGEDRKIHWTKWNLILNSKEKGGLGVTSLRALNLALIYKWRWRYVHCQDSLRVEVLKAIHGHQSNGLHPTVKANYGRVWTTINRSITSLHHNQIIPSSSMSLKLGSGHNIKF